MSNEPTPQNVAAIVVGGGPAGLAAALTLSRSLQPTLVLDPATPPRNAASPGVGALLGRDGVRPGDLRTSGRDEIERYGFARFETDSAVAIDAHAGTGFSVTTASGRVFRADAVILACGMVDLFAEIPGLAAHWGTSVINCPFCHGFELKGKVWGVLCDRPEMLDAAEIYAEWTDNLVFFVDANAPPAPDRVRALEARGFVIETRPIRRLVGEAGRLRAIEVDGATHPCEALVHWPRQRQTDFVASLGLAQNDDGGIAVDEGFRTSRPGLYAAGDLLYAGHQNVNTALHMGNMAAAMLVVDRAKGALAPKR